MKHCWLPSLFEYFPLSQYVHVVLLYCCANSPAWHVAHVDARSLRAKLPGLHSKQDDVPSVEAYSPFTQKLHAESPELFATVPNPHFAHSDELSFAAMRPEMQVKHCSLPLVIANFPRAQSLHVITVFGDGFA